VNAVVFSGIPYNETVNSIGHSWLALQWQSLQGWQFCQIDSYALRLWLGSCGG
jgi:hypothetical protein